jgi:hypothetical protein
MQRKIERQYTAQTWVQACLITGAMGSNIRDVWDEKAGGVFSSNLP